MSKRGTDLREHMLFVAKDVFLESGFDRASMDVIAARAETTKRTLYAHFENKEKLFLAVIELVRGLVLGRLRTPAEYSKNSEEALVHFCGRFLETILWKRSLRMFRLSIAEAERFPEGAALFHEQIFGTAQERLEAYLREHLKWPRKAAAQAAAELLGRIMHPRFTRALFGLEAINDEWLSDERLSAELDLKPIRAAVSAMLSARA